MESNRRKRGLRSASIALRQSLVALAVQACFSTVLQAPAYALPQGPGIVAGQVAISQPAAGRMNVTASNGAIINWKSFSIGTGEATRFIQPSASSAVLNRVVGGSVSQLLGQLQANGRVFLINPNGIVIGNGARIDTNGFLASTLDIADSDFLAGKLRFFATPESGSIVNRGTIVTGAGGQVILLAPNIENSGLIETPGGELLLAAGRKIELANPHLDSVTFEVQAPTDSVLNLGKLLADNGAISVFAGTLKNSGEIRANRIAQGADGSIYLSASSELELQAGGSVRSDGFAGGTIRVDSTAGTARIAGTVSAQGADGKGGDILVTGNRIALESGALVDASGTTGGGQIRIGGDFQGKNPDIVNAQRVFVDTNAQLNADAGQQGDGGRIIIWSDDITRYYGALSAQGGRQGGNGGFAEVSGKKNLEFFGTANLGAPQGNQGTLLLDPLDLIVANSGGYLPSVVDQFTDFPDNLVTISPTALNNIHGNVTLQANRNIYFNDAVALTTSGAGLTAQAGGVSMTGGSVYLNQGITTTGGAVNLSGNTISGSGGITTQGGSVALTTASSLTSYSGAVSTSGGNVSATAGGSIYYTNINAGSGNIQLGTTAGSLYSNTLTGGTVSLNAGSSISGTVNASNRINATSGSSIQLYNASVQPLRIGTVQATSDVYLYGYAGIQQVAGGSTTAPRVRVYANNSLSTIGSAGAPLVLATPQLYLNNLGAPAYVSFSGSPTVTALSMSGTLAALSGTTLTGTANLGSLSLTSGGGLLQTSLNATTGLTSGFSLTVTDAGINAPSLATPGSLTLDAAGPVTLGTINSQSLSVTADNAITVASATTTGGALTLNAGSCNYYNSVCANTSPITAGTLTTGGTGNINVTSSDNGDIDITTLNAGGSATITAANYSYWSSNPRTSAINIGTASTGYSLNAQNYGTGAITFTGAVNTGQSLSLNAPHGAITLQSAATSTNYGISATATGNILFQSLTANGGSGSVSLTSSGGYIETSDINPTADITAATNVTLSASHATLGHIGKDTFTNPLDIAAGASSTVSMTAGSTIGAASKPVTVDYFGASTSGILQANAGGQFHVTTADTLRSIELTTSAAGVGAGGTATLDSAELDITASSNGTTLTIGNISQTNPLNKFAFTASGSSNLAFGNVNLATSGYNELALSAGGTLTQLAGNIVAGHTTLSAGSGQAVNLNNITVASANGNALSITGGNITAGNLSTPSLSISGSNLTLGTVATTGTHQGSWVYVPRLGYNTNVTDQLQLAASSGNLNSGTITSATSATLSAASFNTGNLSAATTLNLTSTGSYAPGAITIGAPTLSIIAPGVGGIDTTGTSVTANTATLRATGGNILSNLTGTTSLTFETGGLFTLASTGTLTYLNAKAAGLTAAGSSLSANSGNQSLTLAGTAPQTFNLQSTTALAATYQETSAITNVNLTANLAGASGFTYSAPGANVTASSVTLGSGNVSLTTGSTGNLTLTSVSTGSGSVTADNDPGSGGITLTSVNTGGGTLIASSAGNIFVGSITTSPSGTVSLTTSAGSISSAGSAIGAAGTVSLSAIAGSIGASGNTMNLASATTLNLTAHDAIDITASGTLTNLSVDTFASGNGGSGGISIVSPNHPSLSITRGSGELVLSALSPTTAGSFTLVARDGNLRVNGDLANFTNLTLNAGNGYNSTADLIIMASGGARSIANSGNLDFRAGRNITISAGSATGESVSIVSGGSQYFNAGGDFSLTANGINAFARTQAGGSQTLYAGNFSVLGGGAGAYTEMTGTSQSFSGIHGSALIRGGTGSGAYAKVESTTGSQSFGSQSTYGNDPTDNITVQGGSGSGAYASLSTDNLTASHSQAVYSGGNISVLGGSGSGAYAEIRSSYNQTVGSAYTYYNDPTANILVKGGTANNAYARISGRQSQSVQAAGNISVIGGNAADSFADIIIFVGSQTIGYNGSSYYYDPTDAITLTAGNASGAWAKLEALDNDQYVYATQNITLAGGNGDNASAVMTGIEQTISTHANLVLTGGTAVTPGMNLTGLYASGATQNISASGSIALTGGGAGADTQVQLTADGGVQSVTAGTSLTLSSPIAGAGTTGIESAGDATNNQILQIGGAMTLSNIGGQQVMVESSGDQTLTAGGALTVGSTSSLGKSRVYSGGDQTVVVGSLRVQGGASAAALAEIQGIGSKTITAMSGGIEVIGGAAGPAEIDPPDLNMVANGPVVVQAGAGATAYALITGSNINIAATSGNISVLGGGASAGITSAGMVNLFGSGNLTISPAGSAQVSAGAPSLINILGTCFGCDTGLFGPFTLNVGSLGSLVTLDSLLGSLNPFAEVLSLLDYASGWDDLNDVYFIYDEDGNLIAIGRRRLQQCS